MYLQNFYYCPTSNCKFDFAILSQAQNTCKSARDQQRINQNSDITQFYSVIVEIIKPTLKFSSYIIKYNGNSNYDEEEHIEFINEQYILKIIDIVDEHSKIKA